MRVVIAGGGTGGHVFPALALADELRRADPETELLFVGSRGGLEEKLVPARGHALRLIEVGKLRGSGLRGLRTLLGLPLAGMEALRLLGDFTPDVVVGVGGYASGPLALAARLRRIPLVLLEQNSIPGTTNRALARLATRVVCAYRRAVERLPADRAVLLGNPVRREILEALQQPRSPRPPGAAPRLLVLGGSQGAHVLNELTAEAAPLLARRFPGLHVLHQTGVKDRDQVEAHYRDVGLAAEVVAFVDDMTAAYREADLVLSRAGATTLAELCVAGLPAVLVPYPFAADDHQAENAAEIAEAGGALTFRQTELTAARLFATLEELLADPERLADMSRAMRAAAFPEAGPAIVRLLEEICRSRSR